MSQLDPMFPCKRLKRLSSRRIRRRLKCKGSQEAFSAAFSLYVSNFANYDKLYGSLGAVIILLFWLYISFYMF